MNAPHLHSVGARALDPVFNVFGVVRKVRRDTRGVPIYDFLPDGWKQTMPLRASELRW